VNTNADRLTVYQDDQGQWRWHAQAANGEIVAQGEAHTRKEDAERAAADVLPGVPIVLDPEKAE
jgi:uncharacterized protein YegP (UPF0339 family)